MANFKSNVQNAIVPKGSSPDLTNSNQLDFGHVWTAGGWEESGLVETIEADNTTKVSEASRHTNMLAFILPISFISIILSALFCSFAKLSFLTFLLIYPLTSTISVLIVCAFICLSDRGKSH